tara:strand:- start:19749 stop:20663 length:915 start_codon:yes stop_codon:yes gene_type:complete
MSRILRITHRTEYSYDSPVDLNPHRLMLRPRDGHDLWVDDALLTIKPKASLRWYFDTFGNSVAEAVFHEPADHLLIQSELVIRRYPSERAFRPPEAHICLFPFVYSVDDKLDLSPYLALHHPQDSEVLSQWLNSVFGDRPEKAFSLLRSLSDAIHNNLEYSSREEMGTQSPAETILRGVGTCRDFAFLFMEAARIFGFAARFVTGYLDDMPTNPTTSPSTSPDSSNVPVGGGATHAWADVFIPGEGWIEFDPTNRIVGGRALIRVATTRTPSQASPVSGSFRGTSEMFLGLQVSVNVSETEEPG